MRRLARYAAAAAVVSAVWCSAAWAPPRHADLRLALAPDRADPAVGEAVVFTASVLNNGPDSALETVVEAQLPAGATLLRAVPSQGRCTGATCNLGLMGYRNLAHDARATVRYVMSSSTIAATISPTALPASEMSVRTMRRITRLTLTRPRDVAT